MIEGNQEDSKKNKFLTFFLAIFLGFIGVHNFYIGRWKRGLIQFGLVLFTIGAGIVITLPWAWLEAVSIIIGKYPLEPKKLDLEGSDADIIQEGEVKASAVKEYSIAIILLMPLLIGSIFAFGIPLLLIPIFYLLVGGLWNKITRVFIKSILPIYATIFSVGKKFLIRFSEHSIPPTQTRAELFRATRKLSMTAVFVLVFLISLIAQSNMSMVTDGDIPDAVVCDDGTIDLLGNCEDGSIGVICDSDCVMENTDATDRIFEAYTSEEIIIILMFAPFITILVAPIIVLRYSSLSIVDKKTRSISPIGEKASDLTNVVANVGSIVLFFQTAWRISIAAAEGGDIYQGVEFVLLILAYVAMIVLLFYPLIWVPMLKFAKSFESHVTLLDNSLVQSKGIEAHQLTYENNELRISPIDSSQ